MIKILIACRDRASMSGLDAGLAKSDMDIAWAESGSAGMSKIADTCFDLLISDENLGDMGGLEFVRKVVSKRPMVNSAVIGSLPPERFHEASEGLGILMQLPVRPKEADAARLLGHLKKILNSMPK